MADIDEELLALAGDASSDEEDAPMNISRDSSASPDGKQSSRATSRKASGRQRRSDSEEEGEASSNSGSPGSQRSAPMDESDSDSDGSPSNMFDEADRFPLEGKFINAADKSEIMAMPEIKREELLAERAQQVERDRQNRALRQLLNAREAGSKKTEKKRKASATDLEESNRKTSRQRTKVGGGRVGEASTGIDNLKRARAEKDDRQRRRQEDRARNGDRKDNAHDDYSDDGGDSELEWDDGKRKDHKSPSPNHPAEPAKLEDYQHVRVGRSRFAQVCFYPGFDEAITGCYARVSIGPDNETGQNVYRMAVIKGFTEGRPYAMETATGKKFITTQYVRCAHGKAEKVWPFITCSDQAFTEPEWRRYEQTCLVEGVTLPTKPRLNQKIADINALINRSWTEAELSAKLERSGAITQKYRSLEISRLTSQFKAARHDGDEALMEKIQAELKALDGPKLAYGTSIAPKPQGPRKMTQQDQLAVLNFENRRKNAEEIRAAQIAERRAFRKIEAAIARGEQVEEDHSRRVKTRAKTSFDVNHVDMPKKSGANTPAASTPKVGPIKEELLPHVLKIQELQKNASLVSGGMKRKPICDDDLIGAIDLGLEIEL